VREGRRILEARLGEFLTPFEGLGEVQGVRTLLCRDSLDHLQ
jgi:hypothetical protein